jgi:hypothetical protein
MIANGVIGLRWRAVKYGSITMDGYVIGLRDEMILMTKDTIEIHVI